MGDNSLLKHAESTDFMEGTLQGCLLRPAEKLIPALPCPPPQPPGSNQLGSFMPISGPSAPVGQPCCYDPSDLFSGIGHHFLHFPSCPALCFFYTGGHRG